MSNDVGSFHDSGARCTASDTTETPYSAVQAIFAEEADAAAVQPAATAAKGLELADAWDDPAVIGGDLGCLLNIEGRLRREGDLTTRVLHVAEVLAGSEGAVSDAPGGAHGEKR